MLAQTKPWVRLMSVVIYIVSGLMLIASVVLLTTAHGAEAAGMSCVYVVVGIVYMIPGVFLAQYATRIGKLLTSRDPADLEAALASQKSFWKFVGIVTLIILIIYGVMLVIGLAFLSMGGFRF